MLDYSSLLNALTNAKFQSWASALPDQISNGLSINRYGDLPQWRAALEQLPEIKASRFTLSSSVEIGKEDEIDKLQHQALEKALRRLIPWRKGPFKIFGLDIDAEWRSDWKWDRLTPHISPLENRWVLDVGCGNGYHCLRMLGENAARVIGIDPSPRFVLQFYMIKKFLGEVSADVLPLGIQELPKNLAAFDTTFSMGVLYHRRSPMDHLKQLWGTLKPGGELVLETLVVEGNDGYSLVPEERYAQMNNVWFIPSPTTLKSWLRKCGYTNVRCVDINQTRTQEQRATSWINGQSLNDFLDPANPNLTVEGHPAPIRGIFIANRTH